MTAIQREFETGHMKSDLYELTLKAYNDSCAEMRSEAREDVKAWEDGAYMDENGVFVRDREKTRRMLRKKAQRLRAEQDANRRRLIEAQSARVPRGP